MKTIAYYDYGSVAKEYGVKHCNGYFWKKEFILFNKLIKGKKIKKILLMKLLIFRNYLMLYWKN